MSKEKRRMLSTDIWEDAGFRRLSYLARLLFIGLINFADDEGRGKGDDQTLKNKVFGYNTIQLEDMKKLKREVTKRITSVKFYRNKGETFYELGRWERYQNIRKDCFRPSKIPPFSVTKTRQTRNEPVTKPPIRLDKSRLDKIRKDKKRVVKSFNL